MKAVIFTLGCKVNEVESTSIMAALEKLGWETEAKLVPADVYILNTCAVTAEAEKKSRQLMARAKKCNPSAEIYVCGCASERDKDSFLKRGAVGVFGARDKEKVVAAVSERYALNYCGGAVYPKQVRTRAFIKISDGCNNFCSYCIIPYLRGRVRDRSIEDITGEIAATNAQEVVINGINISAYSHGGGLYALADALKNEKKRIRLGSLECNVIDERFLTSLKNLYDFAPQFHLSLQSGSDNVLKAMNRKYSRGTYLEKCDLIYSFFPDAAITTDIISGFPTETEDDFLMSLSIIKEARLARVHAFSFSPRQGTAAYKMKDLPPDVKSDRLHRLLAAGEQAEKEYVNKFMGRTLSVLWEQFDGAYSQGYTANYIKVYGRGERSGFENVTLFQRFKDGAEVN